MPKKQKKPLSLLKKILLSFFWVIAGMFFLIVGAGFYISKQASPYIFYEVEKVPSVNVVLVLGASVYQNRIMSDMFKDRADTAVDLYSQGKAKNILISGDNRNKNYNEVVVAQKYLVSQGIPKENIFLDYAGFDTYDSLYRAKEIFKVKDLIVVSQDFHLPRAVYLGKKLHLSVYGFSADRHLYKNLVFNEAREKLANIKALLDVYFQSKPKFLGEPIPINNL